MSGYISDKDVMWNYERVPLLPAASMGTMFQTDNIKGLKDATVVEGELPVAASELKSLVMATEGDIARFGVTRAQMQNCDLAFDPMLALTVCYSASSVGVIWKATLGALWEGDVVIDATASPLASIVFPTTTVVQDALTTTVPKGFNVPGVFVHATKGDALIGVVDIEFDTDGAGNADAYLVAAELIFPRKMCRGVNEGRALT